MLRLAADQNFDDLIVRGLLRELPDLDVVRVRDVGLDRAPDPTVLAWAAAEGRILLTHDVKTMPRHAHERVARGLVMPGVVEVRHLAPIGVAIHDIRLIVECMPAEEIEGQVVYVPF